MVFKSQFHSSHCFLISFTDKNLRIAGEFDCLALGRKPLEPFGDAQLVKESINYTLPDMYPVFPTIDFDQTNNYTLREQGGKNLNLSYFFCYKNRIFSSKAIRKI